MVAKGGARGSPYPGTPPIWFSPNPEPRREADATACAMFRFEQNDIFDLRRELCRSKVFWAENGDGRTRYLNMRTRRQPTEKIEC